MLGSPDIFSFHFLNVSITGYISGESKIVPRFTPAIFINPTFIITSTLTSSFLPSPHDCLLFINLVHMGQTPVGDGGGKCPKLRVEMPVSIFW